MPVDESMPTSWFYIMSIQRNGMDISEKSDSVMSVCLVCWINVFLYKLARVPGLNWFCWDERFCPSKGVNCMCICVVYFLFETHFKHFFPLSFLHC